MTATTSDFAGLLRQAKSQRSRLDELCEFAPTAGTRAETVFWFVRFVGWLRPSAGQRVSAKVRFLSSFLENHPEWAERVRRAFEALLAGTDLRRLFSHGGIAMHFHLGGAIKDWVLSRVLPEACDTSDGAQIIRLAFRGSDLEWIGHPDLTTFVRKLAAQCTTVDVAGQVRAAMTDLGHEIVALAHAPSVRELAQSERSPFVRLYEAIVESLDASADPAPLRGRVRQCILALRGHRDELARRGADFNTTFQLRRLEDQLHRLDLLARLDANFGGDLVATVLRRASGQRLLTRSTDLVIQNLVDSAASVGQSYLEVRSSSWGAAFKAGAGGGAIMVVATIVKLLLARVHLPPLWEGMAFSLNYAAAFCAAYLLHYTIATKLPAHTAATLARCAQGEGGHRGRLAAFVAIWRTTIRLQIAGLLGNVAVAAPVAFAIAFATKHWTAHTIVSPEKAAHILEANTLAGPSVLYAALTGGFLWLSSMLSAAGDNWTRTHRLADRIATNVRVLERVGEARARGWAEVMVHRAGPLFGNASLGFMLGLVPALFAFASIPIEIRHVTVSTCSVAIALASAPASSGTIALAVSGVVLIGITNCVVSFVLALWLALRATRGLRASSSAGSLVRLGIRHSFR